MNERQAEYLLREYPDKWNAMREMREQIVDAYGSGEAYHCGMVGNGGHGDSTFLKASRLVAIGEEESLLKVVREWLTVGMDPRDRAFLICLWRGRTLAEMDRDDGQIGSAARRLKNMVKSLIQFAGNASAENGPACAAIQTRSRREL